MTNLEVIGCPKIEQLLGQEKHICKRHSHLLPSHQLLKHEPAENRKFSSIGYKMNCPMMQTTLSPNLMVYASMTNQSIENNLTPRNKVTITRTGILDCRGKPLLQKLEQITLNDIEIDSLRKFFYSSGLLSPVQCPDSRNFASQFRCSIST